MKVDQLPTRMSQKKAVLEASRATRVAARGVNNPVSNCESLKRNQFWSNSQLMIFRIKINQSRRINLEKTKRRLVSHFINSFKILQILSWKNLK